MPFPLTFPFTFGGTQTPFDDAGDLINDAFAELGFPISDDPYADTRKDFIQMRALLKTLGRELWRKRHWANLKRQTNFTTVQGQSLYPLPDDFGRVINGTQWNRTNRLPVPGPISDEDWEYLEARLVGVTFNVLFRPFQQQIQLYPTVGTPGGFVIAYEYTSRFWVMSDGALAPDKSAPDSSSDIVWFDPFLIVCGLKLKFLKAHNMDTTSAQDDFDVAFADSGDDDGGAPTLRVDGGPRDAKLIGERNVPLTGFGGP